MYNILLCSTHATRQQKYINAFLSFHYYNIPCKGVSRIIIQNMGRIYLVFSFHLSTRRVIILQASKNDCANDIILFILLAVPTLLVVCKI